MTKALTKAFGYLRVSGKGQIDGDGFPRQLEAIRTYAQAQGIRITRVFREEGVCGANELENRPALMGLLEALAADGVKLVLIEKLDRLARDLMIQETLIADLKKRGFNLISVTEPDLLKTDPTRVLMRQIFGAISQYEKNMIVSKLRGARQRMKAKTGRCEGRKPYGHYEGEQAIVDRMVSLRDTGMGYDRIADVLNGEGLKPRTGERWWGKTVNNILTVSVRAASENVECRQPAAVEFASDSESIRQDVISALTNLGSKRNAAEKAVDAACSDGPMEFDPLFRAALQRVQSATA
jgi:DNA invertase Pin-like site-specific DNA recombinase